MTDWSKARVMVTGGCGFIGSHLTRELARLGARIDVIDDMSRGKLSNLSGLLDDVNVITWDLTRGAALAKGYDAVFHLAARVGGISEYLTKPWRILRDNVLMDLNVFQAAVKAEVPRLFYASSGHVETTLSYGRAKLLGEQALRDVQQEGHPLKYFAARIYGAYGPGQDATLDSCSAITAFCRRAAEYPETEFRMKTNGDETRSCVYVRDVVDAILMGTATCEREIYSVGVEHQVSMREIAERVVRASGKVVKILHDDVEATISEQGPKGDLLPSWTPRVGLQTGLEACYADVSARFSKLK